ncbi:hypothetical protein ARAF_0160 [Arsenophonus endosymbiont of Aleurodicus floccissimus]|uniref:hypothetical protein n=1 Tax=Arsenophonus endosymbiont of Aleurodicus floccissimus TaxID=2152761 RepID=UPI000E6B2C35|nr:hypothetical protein [Arsenophonus endosymbiont of Aleurodicus floccissimus]SPP31057.1 hypothetical protein ARAF_0160 [Arsenophonus endosymbiont of Aleurodicus floccissimus]
MASVKNSVAANYQPDNSCMENYGRSNRDNGKHTMRMAITKLYEVVTNSDKINVNKKDLDKLIDKMNHNDVNYYDIKKQVTTVGELKVLHRSIVTNIAESRNYHLKDNN